MSKIKPIIEDSFRQYAGAVLQSRALVDVRDCLKPSARQIFYSMVLNKLVSKNPFKKTVNAVGSAMVDFYIHGDTSCEGVIMRAGQKFAMRYPLVDVKGNCGTPIESGNWAAPRYTESRLSKISDLFFSDIERDTIQEWRDNYENTKQYPSVLPSKGFYNIVNGTFGIGVGAAASIPQFNLKEVNEALKKLLLNPESTFDEIYCIPDFATGGILLNESEVKESLRKGAGSACILRAVVSFDSKERCLIVTEIPYGVYTNTICSELAGLLEDGEKNPGIDRFNDLTGATPLIKIYLNKAANPDKVLTFLYKNTSLQSFFGINMTMLDNGRFPKLFNWQSALEAYIAHEKIVYRRGFEFDLRKFLDKVHILDGILIALANIDEVISIIKQSSSTKDASEGLIRHFLLDEIQAKAILDIKLARLARLEVKKIENEKLELENKIEELRRILSDEALFNQFLIKDWDAAIKEFGDERRTMILNLGAKDEEPIETLNISLSLTNQGGLITNEISSLYAQKKGGVGSKFKMATGERVIETQIGENTDTALLFSTKGNYYHIKINELPIGEKINYSSFLSVKDKEEICGMTLLTKKTQEEFIIFITKNGMLKKSLLKEYSVNRKGGAKALDLNEGDSIVSVVFATKDPIAALTKLGNFVMLETLDIRPIGRTAKGVKGVNLSADDCVISAKACPTGAREVLTITKNGLSKKTSISEFGITGRNTKGRRAQALADKDIMADFLFLGNESEVLVISSGAQLRVRTIEFSTLGRDTLGSKTIKLKDGDRVISLQKI